MSIRIFALLLLAAVSLSAQAPPDTQVLWTKLSESWSSNDLVTAEKVVNDLVAALKPMATDYTYGIQMNSALHNRASFRYNKGDYAGAEADLLESVEQARKIEPPAGIGPEMVPQMMEMANARIRLSLRGLMNFYLASGDLERATRAFQDAGQIVPLWKKENAQNEVTGMKILSSQPLAMEGYFHRASGDFVKSADAYLAQLEELDHGWKLMTGGSDPDFAERSRMNYLRARANLLMDLAEVASLQGNLDEALGFCRQSRESANEMLPLYRAWAGQRKQEDPDRAAITDKTLRAVETNANYLLFERAAQIFRRSGDERGALELLLEGLDRRGPDFVQRRMLTLEYNVIRPEESLQLIGDLQAILGEHDKAAESYRKATAACGEQYPDSHPARLAIKESEVLLAYRLGDADAASKLARELLDARMENLETVLSFADEGQRLAYRSSIDSWSLFATLGLAGELAEAVLKTKGIVLESMLEDRGIARLANQGELSVVLTKLQGDRRSLMESLMGGASKESLAGLRKQIAEGESKLSSGKTERGRTRAALQVSVPAVLDAIPENAVLIEYIRYREFSAPGRFDFRYGAIVLRKGAMPQFIPLSKASELEQALEAYAVAVRSAVSDDEMQELLQTITDQVWSPLKDLLPEKGERIILSPDAGLQFLSFATLLEGAGFVGESWSLSYVSSGRDLLRETDSTRKKNIHIIANPDFRTPATEQVAGERSVDSDVAVSMRSVLGRIGLSPLPGTEAEEKALRELIESDWDWELQSYVDIGASEEALFGIVSPGILHLATHGFYLPQTGKSDPLERAQRYWDPSRKGGNQYAPVLESFSDVVLNNPMHRSGIALAGAAATLQAWGDGRILETEKDGILAAAEMAQLDLDGTWMVVLSACETGLGQARSGEGVLGMRRGLMQAGAQHLLLTLWPVADQETALFMLDFYRKLEGGSRSPVEVAPMVQAEYLKTFREQQGIAAAVRLAGPFILSYQR